MRKYCSDKFVGSSTETKPTGILGAAVYYEDDTRTEYLFVSGVWYQITGSGGGGGTTFGVQNANKGFLGPTGGIDAIPTFRYLISNDIPQNLSINNLILNVTGISYTNSLVTFDFDGSAYQNVSLTGNVTFTGIHTQSGKTVTLKISGDGTARTLAYPQAWQFIGDAARSGISANETAFLTATALGTGDSNVWVVFGHQEGCGASGLFYPANNPSGFLSGSLYWERLSGNLFPRTIDDKVGIHTVSPSETLDVSGTIRIRGGSPQNGYVLTCDSTGVGSWQPASGTGLLPHNHSYCTGIVITGSLPITGTIYLTGLGNTTVKYEGSGVISISGAAGVPAAHEHNYITGAIITGSNPITGLIYLTGFGNTSVKYEGSGVISISGTAGVPAAHEHSYVTGLVVSGSNPITGTVILSGAGDNTVTYSSSNLIIISGTGGGGGSSIGSGDLLWYRTGNNTVLKYSGDSVAIGVTGSSAKVQITGTVTNYPSGILLINGTTASTVFGIGTNEDIHIRAFKNGGTVYLSSYVGAGQSFANKTLINTGLGGVAIGIPAPTFDLSEKFHISGTTVISASNPTLALRPPDTTDGKLSFYHGATEYGHLSSRASTNNLLLSSNRTLGTISLGTTTNNTVRLFINSGGQVGVGTTTPEGFVDVTGYTTLRTNLQVGLNDTSQSGIPLQVYNFTSFGVGESGIETVCFGKGRNGGTKGINLLSDPYNGGVATKCSIFQGDIKTTTSLQQRALHNFTGRSSNAYFIESRVMARDTIISNDTAAFHISALFRATGSVLAQIGQTQTGFYASQNSSWIAFFDISGKNANLMVSGSGQDEGAGTTIDWNHTSFVHHIV